MRCGTHSTLDRRSGADYAARWLDVKGKAMTEEEWLACTDPQKMLEFLRGKASERKLRLFAVACCRRVQHLVMDNRCCEALNAAEAYSDDLITVADLNIACDAARAAQDEVVDSRMAHLLRRAGWSAAEAVVRTTQPESSEWTEFHARLAVRWKAEKDADKRKKSVAEAAAVAEGKAQVSLLHDIFNNPFRPVSLDSAWLAWNDGTVQKIAKAIYDGRAFDRMPILADALEESGCTNADILAHCRQPSEHVRGCWVVDLLLGKE